MRLGRGGTTGDEMVGWHHRLNGHEFEQTLGDSEGQGSVAWWSPWGWRVGHDWVTEWQKPASHKLSHCNEQIIL